MAWRYEFSDWEREVYINDTLLKTVGFISVVTHRDDSGWDGEHYGTGFFVSMKADDPRDGKFPYFITAKHTLRDLEKLGYDTGYIRVNKKAGGPLLHVPVIGGKCWTHPTDSTVDVAVSEVGDTAEYRSAAINFVSTDMFVNADDLKGRTGRIGGIGVGCEVLIPGLFVLGQPLADSTTENMPIVRTGNVAMIPKTQIETGLGYVDAYLIEMRSISGLSGSPVFVRETVVIDDPKTNKTVLGNGRMKLLGLMHGHWDIDPSDINKANPIPTNRTKGVNVGIGIVVPAEKIMEVLNHPELQASRNAAIERGREKRKAMLPKMD